MTNLNDVYLANPVAELAADDLLYLLDDPAGSPVHGAIKKSDLFAQIYNDGWIEIGDTWTYASATTITVPTDATAKYQKGWGIRFKQGGAYKYMYITTVAATLLTVTGGSDYTVANAAITDIAVSPNPNNALGFPDYFNWTPTLTGWSVAPTNTKYQFKIMDKLMHIEITQGTNGTSNAAGTTKVISLPVPAAVISGASWWGTCQVVDNSAIASTPGLGVVASGSSNINFYRDWSASLAWTASGGCRVTGFNVDVGI